MRSDFKYPSDFGFLKKCRIPLDLDSESVTSIVRTCQHTAILQLSSYGRVHWQIGINYLYSTCYTQKSSFTRFIALKF